MNDRTSVDVPVPGGLVSENRSTVPFDVTHLCKRATVGQPQEGRILLDALGLGYEEAQVRAAFAGLDTDQDGQIDFAECSGGWGAEASRAAQTREALRRRDLQGHRRRSAWVTRSQRSWNQVEPTAAELAALGAPRSSCSK